MVIFNAAYTSNVLLFTYMFIYNLSLITLFWVLFSVVLTNFKTLYSFNKFSFSSFHLTTITVLLFSMAGVPPFIGFFSKLFILTILSNNAFFLLYAVFFVVLFFGLYFYIQNIRFLHTTNQGYNLPTYFNGFERQSTSLYSFVVLVVLLLITGLVFVDDFLFLFAWILK